MQPNNRPFIVIIDIVDIIVIVVVAPIYCHRVSTVHGDLAKNCIGRPYGQLREVVLSINRTPYTIIYCLHIVHTAHMVGNALGSSDGTTKFIIDAFIDDAYSGGGDGSTQAKFEGNTQVIRLSK